MGAHLLVILADGVGVALVSLIVDRELEVLRDEVPLLGDKFGALALRHQLILVLEVCRRDAGLVGVAIFNVGRFAADRYADNVLDAVGDKDVVPSVFS